MNPKIWSPLAVATMVFALGGCSDNKVEVPTDLKKPLPPKPVGAGGDPPVVKPKAKVVVPGPPVSKVD